MRAWKLALVLLLAVAAACGPTDDRAGLAVDREALTVCAGPATVKGIDVSDYQGTIDWAKVADAGYRFAIARINDGHHQDGDFAANWAGIKKAGLVRGAYQFYEPTIDPATQAQWVIDAVGLLGVGDLPVTLDVEWTTGTPNATDVGAWVKLVTEGTGKTPMIYTAVGYWNQYFTTQFGTLDLWVANYQVTCPRLPSSWTGWRFWQWGGQTVPGIKGSVDQDLFNGTEAELTTFAGQHAQSGCTAGQALDCSQKSCGCAAGVCAGGLCAGSGCSSSQTDACAQFGCACADGACSGGFCPGTGCTAKETKACAATGASCNAHHCVTPDAGTDAGHDGGADAGRDGGTTDAGHDGGGTDGGSDAGSDGGSGAGDAGDQLDAGTGGGGGHGCTAAPGSLGLWAVALVLRKRAQRDSNPRPSASKADALSS